MTRFQLLLITSFFCVLPNITGYIHYGIKKNIDDPILTNADNDKVEELAEVMHSFHRPSAKGCAGSKSEHNTNCHLSLKVHAFGEDVTVDLKRVGSSLASAATPVWLAQGNEEGNVTFTRAAVNALGIAVELYQDQQTESSIIVIMKHFKMPYFVGVISGLHIRYRSLAARTQPRIQRRPLSNGYTDSGPYIVSKVSTIKTEAQKAAATSIHSQVLNATSLNASAIYPELLVATDYNIHFQSARDRDFYDHLIYILAFFNGVDLIFQQLSAPAVHLHIAGIVVGANPSAAPYIRNNKNAAGVINASAALAEMGTFYGRLSDEGFPASSYDIIVTLTNCHICDHHEEEICSPLFAGVSSLEPVCENQRPIVKAAAIIQDNLAFSGLRMTAHELGHMLGAEHDGEEEEGTQDCNAQDGYLMSRYNESTTVSLKWSKCSLKTFKESMKSSSAECLRNPPQWETNEEPLPSILPGDKVNLHSQCQVLGYVRACAGPQNCNSLTCTNDLFPFNVDCVAVGLPAAQGSPCGFGYHCINADCLKKKSDSEI